MWFEIIPSLAIICAALAAPHGLAYVLNYAVLGNCYRRLMETDQQRMQYLRDRRLTGDPYKISSLEDIPDEPPCEEDGNGNQKEKSDDIEEECHSGEEN